MSIEQLINKLQDKTLENDDVHLKIPLGVKENHYFLFNNEENVKRKAGGLHSRFFDDCGAWVSGSSNTAYFLINSEGHLREIMRKNDEFGVVKRIRVDGKRKIDFQAFTDQPDLDSVITVHRSYSKHTKSSEYKRRISWLQCSNVAVAEYIGNFPGVSVHGNSTKSTRPYTRMQPASLDKVKDMVKHKAPRQVYQDLILLDTDFSSAPHSLKQVRNLKYNEKKKREKVTETQSRANFCDHIQTLASMANTHEFVQHVIHSKSKVPSVVLFTKYQIKDIQRFCCSSPQAFVTPLSFDKTFNLGECHVTLGVYKNLALVHRDTRNHPIFIGPLFIHGNSDFQTFHLFFAIIASHLVDSSSAPIIGSDEEQAMRKAMKVNFPKSYMLLCTRHLKANASSHLSDKCGIAEQQRKIVLEAIFGVKGLAAADEMLVFDYRERVAKEKINEHAPSFMSYFEKRTLAALRENLITHLNTSTAQSVIKWTNNNSESANSLLKLLTNWQPQQLVDLVLKLYDLVKGQEAEVI